MTPADRIIVAEGQRIRGLVLSISDDMEFDVFRRDMFENHGLSVATISKISGIGFDHMIGKHAAGIVTTFEHRGLDQIQSYVDKAKPYHGKALTREEHGDPDAPDDLNAWWLENCPPEYRSYLLSEHINNTNLLDAIFLETHGRLPAKEGRDYYLGQRLRGRSWGAICDEIERNAG